MKVAGGKPRPTKAAHPPGPKCNAARPGGAKERANAAFMRPAGARASCGRDPVGMPCSRRLRRRGGGCGQRAHPAGTRAGRIHAELARLHSADQRPGQHPSHRRPGFGHTATRLKGLGKEAAVEWLPRGHRVAALRKRWWLGAQQGAVSPTHLDYDLDEFTFRFNRRRSAARGKRCFRLLEQAVQVGPVTYDALVGTATCNPK